MIEDVIEYAVTKLPQLIPVFRIKRQLICCRLDKMCHFDLSCPLVLSGALNNILLRLLNPFMSVAGRRKHIFYLTNMLSSSRLEREINDRIA